MAKKTMTADEAEQEFGRFFCRQCAGKDIGKQAMERYDRYRIYCGMLCDECWEEDGRRDWEYDAMDAGESLEEV